MLIYPVSLITADEVAYAGGQNGSLNQKYYLYTGTQYWTISPVSFTALLLQTYIVIVHSNGNLIGNTVAQPIGIRPVINLKSDVLYASGIGTESDPYIITIK